MSDTVNTGFRMREALSEIETRVNSLDEECGVDPIEVRDIARRVLRTTHLRNCDVGTPLEQAFRFKAYCKSHGYEKSACDATDSKVMCVLTWAQDPYREDKDVK